MPPCQILAFHLKSKSQFARPRTLISTAMLIYEIISNMPNSLRILSPLIITDNGVAVADLIILFSCFAEFSKLIVTC